MSKEKINNLCPTCELGQDTYLQENVNPFCPYRHSRNQIGCVGYKKVNSPPRSVEIRKKS